jgi:chitodextrinase
MQISSRALLLLGATVFAPSIGLAQVAPICDANGPYMGQVGAPVQFDGTGSIALPPHMVILYEWDFGDGGTGMGPTPTHVYAAVGTYVVLLKVTQDDNLQSTCITKTLITSPTAVQGTTWGRVKVVYR